VRWFAHLTLIIPKRNWCGQTVYTTEEIFAKAMVGKGDAHRHQQIGMGIAWVPLAMSYLWNLRGGTGDPRGRAFGAGARATPRGRLGPSHGVEG